MIDLPPVAAVYGIYGSLGGGKSLTAVDIALHFIKSFNFVCSNIQLLNLSPIQSSYYQRLDDISKVNWFDLPLGSPRGSSGRKRVAIILDEMPELLDQYSSGKEFWIKQFLSWLRHTSKNGQYVFIITQDPSFILKPVRLLCAYWVRCDDMANLRIPIINLKIPFFRDYVIRRIYDRDGNCITKGLNIARKSEIGRFYRTSQGLSLYSASTIPNEFKDRFSKYIQLMSSYRFLLIWNSLFILLSIVFLFLFFLL